MRSLNAEVLVIGAGPAGLTAALYAARAGKKTLVLEGRAATRMAVGYQIENYPGFTSVDSRELLGKFRDHAAAFGAEFVKGDVLALSLATDPKFVTTSEALIETRAVILAMGRPMSREKLLPGEERLTGLGVSYCAVCDGPLYRGREVAAYGASEEAYEDMLALRGMNIAIHWITGKLKSGADEADLVRKAGAQGIKIYPGAEIKEIVGEKGVERVTIVASGEERPLEVAGLFIFREVPTGPLLSQAGLAIDHKQCLAVDRFQQTNIDGVFAAGDLTCGGQQVVSAAGEGCVAALGAVAYLRRATPAP